MAHVLDWVASLVGGRTLRRGERAELRSVGPGQIETVEVETDHRLMPLVRLELQPERGDAAHVFTRVMRHPAGAGELATPVFEVAPDPAAPDRFVRVYLMPEGILITTRDRYF